MCDDGFDVPRKYWGGGAMNKKGIHDGESFANRGSHRKTGGRRGGVFVKRGEHRGIVLGSYGKRIGSDEKSN